KQLRADGFKGVDSALKSFELIIARDQGFVPAYISAADAYLLKYEFSKKKNKTWLNRAYSLLSAAIERDGDSHVAFFKRAITRFNLGQMDRGVRDVKKAMEIRPDYLDARILYLQHLLSIKDKAKARKFARSSLKIFPDNPAPMKFFGDVFFREGVYEDAVFFYKKVLERVRKAPNTYMLLGESYSHLKKSKEAIAAYKKGLGLKPDMIEARFSLGRSLTDAGQLKEAIGQYKMYLVKNPKHVSTLNNLAILYEKTGQNQKAKLAWLKLKEATHDRLYVERAERHLYGLLHSAKKKRPATDDEKSKKKE
ncbi:hypothetical protein MNBD_NITROSPINAE02-370, partial [hydrothermal vent metagenome]